MTLRPSCSSNLASEWRSAYGVGAGEPLTTLS